MSKEKLRARDDTSLSVYLQFLNEESWDAACTSLSTYTFAYVPYVRTCTRVANRVNADESQ